MEHTGARWRKSSFSNGNSSQNGCVEVARLSEDVIGLRDSKDTTRPAHYYPTAAWSAFLAGIRAGDFEQP